MTGQFDSRLERAWPDIAIAGQISDLGDGVAMPCDLGDSL
jgi:hypothetical protein